MRETGGKATGTQVSQETGGKGEMLMRERDPDNSLPVIEGVRKRARVFVGGLNS